MNGWRAYRSFFLTALVLHCLLVIGLIWEHSTSSVALKIDSGVAPVAQLNQSISPQHNAIEAHSIDAQAVTAAVEELKLARAKAAEVEQKHQQQLLAEARAVEQKRVQAQRHIEALKAEAARLARIEQQRVQREQQHLAELAKQKELQKQQLLALQNEQRELRERMRKAEKAKIEQAANTARMAAVIDQYKARITHAISQQWILPEHADRRLSSQFRIRLNTDGRVLEVMLTRSSGDTLLDRSAQAAIYKASPLPVPPDAELNKIFQDISLTVRPENSQS